ncbi:MAG: hypothetical protein J6J42_11450 [Lachnospiraceae bacterium]|nr:hypothetical protein [Lachnospiraceae bacterium]
MDCGRKMIYFSLYKDGRKVGSAGYAGLFFHGSSCNVQIYYRGAVTEEAVGGQELRPVYVFRDGKMIEGSVLLLSEGMAMDSFSTDRRDFLKSGKTMEELEAVYITGSFVGICGGRLDGRELEEETAYTLTEWMDTVAELIPEAGEVYGKGLDWQQEERQEYAPGISRNGQESGEMVTRNLVVEEDKKKDTGTIENETERQAELERWTLEQCMEQLPEQKLPFDGIRRKCCRMTLEELGHLPKEWDGLKENNFLLHGYYEYHHLLLIQLCGRCGIRYAIGVPGKFCYINQYMAENFGFVDFSPLEQGKRRKGSFGYWCCYLEKKVEKRFC